MAALPGVTGAVLNATTGRLVVTGRADLSAIRLEGRAEEYTVTPEGAEAPAAPAPRITEKDRLIVAASAAVLGYAIRLLGGPDWLVIPAFAIATVTGGWSNFRKALRSIPRRDVNMSVLMSIAVAGAIAIGRYEEAGVVATLFAFSDMLESWTMDRARRSIRELMDIAPHSANIERGASVVEVPVAEVVVGDIMHVRPGEKIGMDGVVVGGSSAVNQAAITGESIPVEKMVGDDVYAGTLNVHGLLRVEVRRLVEDTTIARIIHMVEEAQARRAPLQTFVERFAAVYTPVVIALAVGIAVLPPLVAGAPWLPWIYRSLTLLVVSCPCALVVSTPVAIVSAISNAARNGVLVKGGVYLEQMGSVSAIAFDKTGTLTFGEPAVTAVEVIHGHEDVNSALALAAAVEQHSEHPLARAIMRAAHARELNVPAAHEFEATFGSGASATVDGQRLRIGSARLFPDASGTLLERVAELESEGNTVLLFGDHDGPSALIAVADAVRPESAGVIARLRESGIRHAVMLTGDNERVAAVVAAAVGTDRYEAGLLPEDKVGAMKRLVADYGSVAMVGDGVNDAPALATATIGIAMGGAGSDTALETADIVLLSDELDRLPFTVELSRATLRTIRANIAFAIGVKLIAVLAVVPGWLTLWIAILADMGASLVVTLNGIRMLEVGRKG